MDARELVATCETLPNDQAHLFGRLADSWKTIRAMSKILDPLMPLSFSLAQHFLPLQQAIHERFNLKVSLLVCFP